MEKSKAEKYVIWRTNNVELYKANLMRQNQKRQLKTAQDRIIKLQKKN